MKKIKLTTVKMAAIVFVVMIGLLTFSACSKKDKGSNPPKDETEKGLTNEEVTLLDGLKTDTLVKLADLQFEDGTSVDSFLYQHDSDFLNKYPSKRGLSDLTPDEQKKLFLARMQAMGFHLTTRAYHKKNNEGSNKPAQNGLAYVFGSKDDSVRTKPQGSCSENLLYGLDCSGMIYQMAYNSGLTGLIPQNVSGLGEIKNWNEAFENSWYFRFIRSKDLGNIPLNEIRFGDLIVWPRHIGMVLNGKTLSIFQSNGSSESPKCQNNTDENHGPTIKSLTTSFVNSFGAYKIIRIESGVPCGEDEIKVTYKLSTNNNAPPYGPYELTFYITGGYAPYKVTGWGISKSCCSSSDNSCCSTMGGYVDCGQGFGSVSENPYNGKYIIKILDTRNTYKEVIVDVQ